jgi:hypothetical protein
VKSISSKFDFSGIKTLAIMRNLAIAESEAANSKCPKIILTNTDNLSFSDVQNIFKFWFTSAKKILDLRVEHVNTETDIKHEIKPETTGEHTSFRLSPAVLPRFEPSKISPNIFADDSKDRIRINKTIREVYGIPDKEKSKKPKHKNINIFNQLIYIAIIFVSIILLYVSSLAISGVALIRAGDMLDKGQISKAHTFIYISTYLNRQASVILYIIKIPFIPFGQNQNIRHQEQLISFLTNISDVTLQGTVLINESKKLSISMLSEIYGEANPNHSIQKTLDIFKTELPSIHNKIGISQAELNVLLRQRIFPFNYRPVAVKAEKLANKLNRLREEITFLENTLHVYEYISGFNESKTYLVLFQNSMELRPTGGFIGSYAEVKFTQGHVDELNIQDVYSADGQLKEHIDPPLPIREILNNEHWYMRDSNWDPNFSKSGKIAAWFYEKETGRKVDGVIAVSTPFITDLLKATGPVDLSDFKDRITADNFFGKSLYYTQNNFFPGSTQKKDFLGSLVKEMLGLISRNKSTSSIRLLDALHNAMNGGEIQFYFTDPQSTRLVEQYGWAGDFSFNNICDQTRKDYPCYPDFIRAVEANLAVSKVNYFVTRDYNLKSSISEDGKISQTLEIKFNNTANGKEAGQAGNYRNYLRLYLPADSIVSSVSVDGTNLQFRMPKDTGIMNLPYAEFLQDIGTTEQAIGIALDIPAQTEKIVTIKYIRASGITPGNQGVFYRVAIVKQPGVRDSHVESTIKFPSTWIATPQSDPEKELFLANSTELEYNTILNQNIYSSVLFQTKE